MCGITGIFAYNQIGSLYMINLVKAMNKLENRGPDWRGSYIDDNFGLGHRRLSIIDTSRSGDQPMKDETGRFILVYNGEIFNYQELRAGLINKGVSFNSNSDTEVLLKLLIFEGPACLEKLIGFFSFALIDTAENSILLARDRFGIKPLYYYEDEDKFLFASELKSLLAYNIERNVDNTAVLQYLQFGFIPAPHSIIKGVRKLEPGTYLNVKKRDLKVCRYYDLTEKSIPITDNYDTAKRKIIEMLDDSVEKRMISDVPLGAFLSGGIDSSVIVALASNYNKYLNTFSIGFKDEPFFDETKYAKLVADKFQTNHTVFTLTNEDLLEEVYNVLDYIDEPFSDSSVLPFYILSKRTSKKMKVALSGDGGDEVFGGYNKHFADYKIRQGGFLMNAATALLPLLKQLPSSRNSPFYNKVRQAIKLAEGAKLREADRYLLWCSLNNAKTLSEIFTKNFWANADEGELEQRNKYYQRFFKGKPDINQVLLSDINFVLPNDMLFKADMMSMANSLEVRTPFLDHRLVEYVNGLPSSFKIGESMQKRILQDAFKDILPKELYRRPKQGFDVPMMKWFKFELRPLIKEQLLEDEFIKEQGIFSPEYIKGIKEQLFGGKSIDQDKVWNLLVFQYWYRKYIFRYN
ncbi:hypothetical protein MYP_998 [Sporocytophaga myxococcoides]|uniref:asparagine synthase (glutamine-hydrolyzing) n=1 Tax=Sporocytophaga myxococcoides TaxID=153721 RepID=A0A098LA59_9BACT|nr:asparagine synthase (glutamine-hydrolyzing) [Sporocytophaga myxococcoides]GAL83770.1 hypothetical protein MYP_998 [Sporocytophaga myxococcoides]